MKSLASFVVLVASLASIGCGGGPTVARLPTVPVKGKLLVDGKPRGGCTLTLSSTAADLPTGDTAALHTVSATVKEDGTFVLGTYSEADGAPVGSYKVVVSADIGKMQMSVPACKPATVDITKPADGKPLEIELKLESSGQDTLMGGTMTP